MWKRRHWRRKSKSQKNEISFKTADTKLMTKKMKTKPAPKKRTDRAVVVLRLQASMKRNSIINSMDQLAALGTRPKLTRLLTKKASSL